MTQAAHGSERPLTVARGSSLYVAAVVGPGLLFIPFVAVQVAGPAAIVAWAALLILSVPLVISFAALGLRFPSASGVSAYVRVALGSTAAAAVGACFLAEVVLGGAAVVLIGGDYVAALTGGTREVVVPIAVISMYVMVIAANYAGLRTSTGTQVVLSSLTVSLLMIAVVGIVPERLHRHWLPFAPHGWWAVGAAANLLVWLFFGWETMAQLASEFRQPRDLRRSVAFSFATVTCIYIAMAIATIVEPSGRGSSAPLADLVAVAFGRAGRDVSIALAVGLTVGTMNVATAAAARLAASLSEHGHIPTWFAAGDGRRDIPRRPLFAIALTTLMLMLANAVSLLPTGALVRATAACLVSVYVLTLTAAVRLLESHLRRAALLSLALVVVVAAFSSFYLLVPVSAALIGIALHRGANSRQDGAIVARGSAPRC